MKHLLYFVVIAAVMLVLAQAMPGFHVDGWGAALIASVVLAVANTLVKPVLFLLTLPLTLVTLGLFLLVLNAGMLWLTDLLVPGLRIDGPVPTFLAAIVLALAGALWKALTKEPRRRKSRERDSASR